MFRYNYHLYRIVRNVKSIVLVSEIDKKLLRLMM